MLTWQKPTTNESGTLSCVPSGGLTEGIPAQENIKYRIYRSTGDPMFTADPDTNMIWDESSPGSDLAYDPGSGTVTFIDSTAANCVNYYYRVEATDLCGDDASLNFGGATGVSEIYPAAGSAGVAVRNEPAIPPKPAPPTALEALPTSNCDAKDTAKAQTTLSISAGVDF